VSALVRKCKSEISLALISIGWMFVALFLAMGAVGFLLVACFIRLRYEMDGSTAAMVMAGAMAISSFVIVLAVATIRRKRRRVSLDIGSGVKNNTSETAFNDIAEWLEGSGFSDEAKSLRATLILSHQARPYSIIAVSFLFGFLTSTRFGRVPKSDSKK
jgi:hypothetical protein